MDARVVHPKTIHEDISLGFGRGFGRNAGIIGQRGRRRAISVDIQGRFVLRPGIAEVIGPISHDKAVSGHNKETAGLLGENLEHVALSLHADVAGAVDIGGDAVDPGVVHVDGGGASIQMDIAGRSGAGQQTEHHDDGHNDGHKPCFFHCTFLLKI